MVDEPQEIQSANHVPALVRAKDVLDLLSAQNQPRGISDIARALNLPKSSVHGICRTLADLGVLRRGPANTFSIGAGVLGWASAFAQQSSLIAQFQQLNIDQSHLGGGALNLSILHGQDVVYVSCRPGTSPLGMSFRVGMSLPAVFTATGKAMLSTWPVAMVRDRALPWPQPVTRNSVPDLAAFEAELAETRIRGYSIEEGQLREGMSCLGVPIFDVTGDRAIAGLALGLLTAEARDRIDEYGKGLTEVGRALSSKLGASGPLS